MQASDLTVNGIEANSVILTGARTARFHFNATPVTIQGQQTIHMAAGTVRTLSPDTCDPALQEYISHFDFGVAPPPATGPEPLILLAAESGATTTVKGLLRGIAGQTYTVEFWSGGADPWIDGYPPQDPSVGSIYSILVGKVLDIKTITATTTGDNPFTFELPSTNPNDAIVAIVDGGIFSGLVAALPPTADAGGPYVIKEGDSFTLSASASLDTVEHPLTYSWDVNGNGTFGDGPPGDGLTGGFSSSDPTLKLTWEQLNALGITDGANTYNVRVHIDDDHGQSDTSRAVTLTVQNVPPTVTISNITPGGTANAVNLTLSASDPSSADQSAGLTYTVNWDDGVTNSLTTHTYASSGQYNVSVTATDKDGGVSAAATARVILGTANADTITFSSSTSGLVYIDGQGGSDSITVNLGSYNGTVLVADSGSTSDTDTLLVNGTSAADELTKTNGYVKWRPLGSTGPYQETVTFSGMEQETLNAGAGNDTIHDPGSLNTTLLGGPGDDTITIADTSGRVVADGGDGNDRLKGGSGPNVPEGGAGDDLLVGGSGRDLLIGGTGSDRMIGNGGDDILIGGITTYDTDAAALIAIMAEWTSSHSFATRVANLTDQTNSNGFGSRLNGAYFLLDQGGNQTVFNDTASDTLTGSAGSDWFFAGTADKITDLNAIDQAFIFGL